MEVKRSGSQPSGKGPAEYFTGTVRVDPLFQAPDPARVTAASVTFEPSARTNWHTHPLGQTLIVTAGCGLVRSWGGPIRKIRPGDVVVTVASLVSLTADHYVFCGNGSDEDPEPDVVEKLVKARRAAKPTRPFKLWFNSSSAAAEPKKNKDHMNKVENLVASLVAAAPAKWVQSFFLSQSSFDLPV